MNLPTRESEQRGNGCGHGSDTGSDDATCDSGALNVRILGS